MSVPVRRGDVVEIEIDDLGHEGDGVAHYRGYVLFVPGAAPGDRVQAEVVRRGSTFGTARLCEVVTSSSERVDPPCDYYGRCGGCRLQHIDYEAELKYKRAWVRETAERIAGASDPVIENAVGSRKPYSYRERSRFAVEPPSPGGRGIIGFRRRASSDLVDIRRCHIQMERNNRALQGVREVFASRGDELDLWAIDEFTLRSSEEDTLVLLVTDSPSVHLRRGAAALLQEVPEVSGVARIDRDGAVHPFAGGNQLCFAQSGHRICSSPSAFTQVNRGAAADLYRQVLCLADPGVGSEVVDLFSGVGALSMLLACRAERVFAVDWNAAAVQDARENARVNGIENITHLCLDAAAGLQQAAGEASGRLTVVMDPPRSGCPDNLLEEIALVGPSRIVYIACGLGTWGRDVGRLRELGWHLLRVIPVDMFPQTANVEIASLLEYSPERKGDFCR